MFLYKNQDGLPVYMDDFYVTIGKNGAGKIIEGDQKTPLGVYFVTRFIESGELPDLYGDGAFPINYPNIWDRRNGRTGTGIWLHGTPSTIFSRPPEDSDGCREKIIEGDQKTPLGVYFVTRFIESGELPDLYGDGAFPINYPNIWDRRNGRTGTGIWLHGTPSTIFSRPPEDSDG